MTQWNNDSGLSEVIGFVLILALVIAAISLWMTYVLPAQGRELEISHMDNVGDWFLDYKIAVDSLWMNSETGVTDSTTLALGSKGGNTQTSGLFLPMMQPVGSAGTLAVNNTAGTMTVTADNNIVLAFPMSSLTYNSNNNYWINQQYYYQMGGVFLSQDEGVTNVVSPLISIYNVYDPFTTIVKQKIVIIPINLTGGGTIAGKGNARVDFRLQEQALSPVTNTYSSVKIDVKVNDPNTAIMWRNLFRDIANRGNVTDYTLSLPSTTAPYEAYIYINNPNNVTLMTGQNRANFSTTINTIQYV